MQRKVGFDVVFHGVRVGRYRADTAVDSKVAVDVKAVRFRAPAYAAQLINSF